MKKYLIDKSLTRVYHTKDSKFSELSQKLMFDDPLGYIPKQDDYELVAFVETDNLAIAHRQTNHIDNAWWLNSDVVMVKESRSTSIGDILEINLEKFVCARDGWVPVEWESVPNDKFYADLFKHWNVDIEKA